MINPEKVRLMSRLSILESDTGAKELNIASYKKLDYVIIQVVKGFFFGVILFVAIFFFWFCMNWDDLNLIFADAAYMSFIQDVLKKFMVFEIAYMGLSGVIAVWKHSTCKKRRKKYLRMLNKLNRMSAKEE